jgi:lipid II:glycine glycyltransferase (peptidoglycan interpeptide bridge formation enzyme)
MIIIQHTFLKIIVDKELIIMVINDYFKNVIENYAHNIHCIPLLLVIYLLEDCYILQKHPRNLDLTPASFSLGNCWQHRCDGTPGRLVNGTENDE